MIYVSFYKRQEESWVRRCSQWIVWPVFWQNALFRDSRKTGKRIKDKEKKFGTTDTEMPRTDSSFILHIFYVFRISYVFKRVSHSLLCFMQEVDTSLHWLFAFFILLSWLPHSCFGYFSIYFWRINSLKHFFIKLPLMCRELKHLSKEVNFHWWRVV